MGECEDCGRDHTAENPLRVRATHDGARIVCAECDTPALVTVDDFLADVLG